MKILAIGDFQGNFSEKLKNKLKKEEFDLVLSMGDYAGIDDWKPYIMKMLGSSKKGLKRMTPQEFFGKNKFKALLKKDRDLAKNVLKNLNNLKRPVISIFGNSDDDWYNYKFSNLAKPKTPLINFFKKLKNIKDITYSKTKYENISFIGFGGYMDIDAFFDKKEWKDETEEKRFARILRREASKNHLIKILKKVKGEKIFVFHYPPKGAFDIIKSHKSNPMNGKSAGIGFFKEAILKHKPKIALCGHMHEYQGVKKIGSSLVINPGDAQRGKYAIIDYPLNRKEKINVRFEN